MKELMMSDDNVHTADLLCIEGSLQNATCDWRYVEQKRWDIIKKMTQLAKLPYKIYRVLAEREDGYESLARENKTYHFEIIEKTEITSLRGLTND
jgi:hypothetical protein